MGLNERKSRLIPLRSRDQYTIGIVCALTDEAIAVQSAFDYFIGHDERVDSAEGDLNAYSFGVIEKYHVVLAHMGDAGGLEAKEVASNMHRSFRNIKLCLVVGVCGIVPQIKNEEALLGDVIISTLVKQYDRGKEYLTGFKETNMLGPPSSGLKRAMAPLRTPKHRQAFFDSLKKNLMALETHEDMGAEFCYPGHQLDNLYDADYAHEHRQEACTKCHVQEYCESAVEVGCEELQCDSRRTVQRKRIERLDRLINVRRDARTEGLRKTLDDELSNMMLPKIFFGSIASGNKVLKNGKMRDKVSAEQDVAAFEMEGAGVWNTFPTVVIKAGCDYADSHKSKTFQKYACMVAAACAKTYLGQLQMGIPPNVAFGTALPAREGHQNHCLNGHKLSLGGWQASGIELPTPSTKCSMAVIDDGADEADYDFCAKAQATQRAFQTVPLETLTDEPVTRSSDTDLNDSLTKQAEPYRLLCAKFPLDCITTSWSKGSNRPIDEAHCNRLVETFNSGLFREDSRYYLRLSCSKQDVDRILTDVQNRHQSGTLGSVNQPYADFMRWKHVNSGLAELMAGAHRVRALETFLRRRWNGRLDKSQWWWICEIYDRDRLPFELALQLRANRGDVSLQDSNGHIWHEMVTLARHNPILFTGNMQTTEVQIKDHLLLNGRNNIPVRRLGTLWRNERWRTVITKLCEHPFGQSLFNIYTFEWMSSCRMDDFWFDPLSQVIEVLTLFHDRFQVDIAKSDWAVLSQDSSLEDTPAPVADKLFYYSSDPVHTSRSTHTRVKGLFARVNDDVFANIYQLVLDNAHLRFPAIQEFLKISKADGKSISLVLGHVGQWLHSRPFVVLDRAAPKPQLRCDFVPALRAKYGDDAESVSINLQKEIALWVKAHMRDLTHKELTHLLQELPISYPENYNIRFKQYVWSSLLQLVYNISGPHFQGANMQYFNEHPPETPNTTQIFSLPLIVSRALCDLPELNRNPLLKRQTAIDDLVQHLQPAVAQWIVRHCSSGLDEPWRWPEDVQTVLREDIEKAKFLIEGIENDHGFQGNPSSCSEDLVVLPPPRVGARGNEQIEVRDGDSLSSRHERDHYLGGLASEDHVPQHPISPDADARPKLKLYTASDPEHRYSVPLENESRFHSKWCHADATKNSPSSTFRSSKRRKVNASKAYPPSCD